MFRPYNYTEINIIGSYLYKNKYFNTLNLYYY